MTLRDKLDTQKLNTQVLDGIADMVRIVDVNNRVIFFNRSMEETFDGELDQLLCPMKEGDDGICDLRFSERTLQTGEIIQREEKIGEGYFSVKTSPILGDDGQIKGAIEVFRNKTREKKLQIEITHRNKQMTKEMNAASNIQKSLVPNPGRIRDLDFKTLYEPAAILSGDIFDIFPINKTLVAFYMADSVGHGFASSMTTMFIYQALRNMPKSLQKDPSLALVELQDRFSKLSLNVSNYFTIVYGVYNSKEKTLTFANAGHNCPPLIYSKGKVEEVPLRGFPINPLFASGDYDTGQYKLKEGDQVLLITDGLVECVNQDQVQYGLDRLKAFYEKNPPNFLEDLQEDIRSFSYRQPEDDMSALWLKLEGGGH
ncbi:MAG: SpoIIE family protein phosphatase [Tissierellia bacterium]|nr:SpoIIE family protein phosphatase [Tissierellia bacterium]